VRRALLIPSKVVGSRTILRCPVHALLRESIVGGGVIRRYRDSPEISCRRAGHRRCRFPLVHLSLFIITLPKEVLLIQTLTTLATVQDAFRDGHLYSDGQGNFFTEDPSQRFFHVQRLEAIPPDAWMQDFAPLRDLALPLGYAVARGTCNLWIFDLSSGLRTTSWMVRVCLSGYAPGTWTDRADLLADHSGADLQAAVTDCLHFANAEAIRQDLMLALWLGARGTSHRIRDRVHALSAPYGALRERWNPLPEDAIDWTRVHRLAVHQDPVGADGVQRWEFAYGQTLQRSPEPPTVQWTGFTFPADLLRIESVIECLRALNGTT